MKYTAVIVDDEQDAREGISLLLQQDESIEVKAHCSDGITAILAINNHKPDILFLDIQMPQITGFDVLRSVNYRPKATIFTTAYDEFALKAFEVHAIDYLLKPFSDTRFYEALQHAKSSIGKDSTKKSDTGWLNALDQENMVNGELIERPVGERLAVKDNGKIHLLELSKIRWLEAYDYYIKVHLSDHFLLVRDSLKNMETKLKAHGFIRIHKSSLVNTLFIATIQPALPKEYSLTLKEGQQLKVSRNYKAALFEYLNMRWPVPAFNGHLTAK